MSTQERLTLVRERLTACQVALACLTAVFVEFEEYGPATTAAQQLAKAFLALEDAAGAPITPASLFSEGDAA